MPCSMQPFRQAGPWSHLQTWRLQSLFVFLWGQAFVASNFDRMLNLARSNELFAANISREVSRGTGER